MTQRQITHPEGLPACHAGHVARHIHDQRAPRAGGGHLVECQCRATTRHATFDAALTQWCRDNQRPAPTQQPLPLPQHNILRFGSLQ